jgi:hypothetical protein
LHLLCLKIITIFWGLLGKMPSTQKNGMQQYTQSQC